MPITQDRLIDVINAGLHLIEQRKALVSELERLSIIRNLQYTAGDALRLVKQFTPDPEATGLIYKEQQRTSMRRVANDRIQRSRQKKKYKAQLNWEQEEFAQDLGEFHHGPKLPPKDKFDLIQLIPHLAKIEPFDPRAGLAGEVLGPIFNITDENHQMNIFNQLLNNNLIERQIIDEIPGDYVLTPKATQIWRTHLAETEVSQ